MHPIAKIVTITAVAAGAFLIRQYRVMLNLSGEVTQRLKENEYTIYTGKPYEESDLYDERVFKETRCHYYDKFYKSGNVSPGMLKGMFKWKYNQKITNKDVKDVFTDISTNTGQFAQECAMSYILSKQYLKNNKENIKRMLL